MIIPVSPTSGLGLLTSILVGSSSRTLTPRSSSSVLHEMSPTTSSSPVGKTITSTSTTSTVMGTVSSSLLTGIPSPLTLTLIPPVVNTSPVDPGPWATSELYLPTTFTTSPTSSFQQQTSSSTSPQATETITIPGITSSSRSSLHIVASSISLLPSPSQSSQPEQTTPSKGGSNNLLYSEVAGSIGVVVFVLLIAGALWRRRRSRRILKVDMKASVDYVSATNLEAPFDPSKSDIPRTIWHATQPETDEEKTKDVSRNAGSKGEASVHDTVGIIHAAEYALARGDTVEARGYPAPVVLRSRPIYAEDAGVRLAGGPADEVAGTDTESEEQLESGCSTLPPPYGTF